MRKRKQMCEYGRFFYWLAIRKESFRRNIVDFFSKEKFCRRRSDVACNHIVKGHRSILLRQLNGVDMQLQINKVHNFDIALPKLDGAVVRPGETFSFWRLVGQPGKRQGYRLGLTLASDRARPGYGGGLCQIGNMIHWLVLHSPLTVTEIHHHTDCIFPDSKRRVPFGTGTSIFYKSADYRFKNTTDQDVMLRLWMEDGDLCGELRSERAFAHTYRLEEVGHHFCKEGNDYFRVSRVFKKAFDRNTKALVDAQLILDNHSKVLYDHTLIPKEEIQKESVCDAHIPDTAVGQRNAG